MAKSRKSNGAGMCVVPGCEKPVVIQYRQMCSPCASWVTRWGREIAERPKHWQTYLKASALRTHRIGDYATAAEKWAKGVE